MNKSLKTSTKTKKERLFKQQRENKHAVRSANTVMVRTVRQNKGALEVLEMNRRENNREVCRV